MVASQVAYSKTTNAFPRIAEIGTNLKTIFILRKPHLTDKCLWCEKLV